MKKRIISLGLVIEIITFSIIVSFMSPVAVLALSAGGLQSTIASIIISLMLQCGVAPVNQAWLNTLNTSYGVESSIGTIQDCINSGLLTQSGNTLIDTGLSTAIESQSAYTELGLSQIFTTSADDVAQGVIAGSGGVNLANVAINCGTLGTIGAFAGAVAVGIGAGVLLNKIGTYFYDNIRYGVPINFDKIMSESELGGDLFVCMDSTRDSLKYQTVSLKPEYKAIPLVYYSNNYNRYSYQVLNSSGQNMPGGSAWVKQYNGNRQLRYSSSVKSNTINGGLVYGTNDTSIYMYNNYYLVTEEEFNNIQRALYNNEEVTLPERPSKDLIGDQGNYVNVDQMKNMIPEGYDMKPVDMNNYQNYVDNANNNTEDGNTGEAVQGEQFDDLIDSLLVEPSLIPDQGVETPDVPDRPIIPDQPETPGKDPITPEEQADVLEGITTPDLRSVFPFCIPFDLFSLLGELKDVNREAPVLVWEMPEELGGYSIILDFSMFDDAAALLRLLELAVFIVGLAVETRNLIGAKG